jgi:hypothetical protein
MRLQSTDPAGAAATYCRALIAADGDIDTARAIASKWGMAGEAGPGVTAALHKKTAVAETGTELLDEDWIGITSGFIAGLGHYGVFDRLLQNGLVQLPLRSRVAIASAAATASILPIASVKPLTALSLASDTMTPVKAVGHVIMSREFAMHGGAMADNILRQELTKVVATATDLQFIATMTDAVSSTVTPTGIDARAVRRDLQTALARMTTTSNSRLYVLVHSSTAKNWATQFDSTGNAAFPEMGPQGGRVCGMDCLVSDVVSASDVLVVDASQIVAASDAVDFRVGTHASVQMTTAPDSPVTTSTVWVSLWQSNLIGLLAERYFGAVVIGSDCVQQIDGSAY